MTIDNANIEDFLSNDYDMDEITKIGFDYEDDKEIDFTELINNFNNPTGLLSTKSTILFNKLYNISGCGGSFYYIEISKNKYEEIKDYPLNEVLTYYFSLCDYGKIHYTDSYSLNELGLTFIHINEHVFICSFLAG